MSADTTQKLRGVFLAALMVLSIVVGSIAFAGTASAAANGPVVTGAVEYAQDAQGTPQPTVEVSFNESVTDPSDGIDADNIKIYKDGTELGFGDADVTALGGEPTRTVEVAIPEDVNPMEDLVVNVTGVEDTGGNAITPSNTSVTVTGATLDATGANYGDPAEDTVFRGTTIAVEFPSVNDDYTLYNGSDEFRFQGSTGEASRIAVFDSEDRNSTVYRFDDEDSGGADVELWDLDLETTLSDTAVQQDESFDVDVESNAGGRETVLTVESNETDTSVEMRDTLAGDGTLTFGVAVQTLDVGTYTVNVTDADTGVSRTAGTVEVQETVTGDVEFSETMYEEDSGDIAEITLEFTDRETATLNVGSEDVNFISNISVTDEDEDGEVTITLDTTAAGGATSPSEYFGIVADDDDDATDSLSGGTQTEGVDSPLEAAVYELEVEVGGTVTDVGSLQLHEPTIRSVEMYTASGSETFDEPADVEDALRATETVAKGDYIVTEINASGFEGTPTVAPKGIDFTMTEVNPGANTVAAEYDETTQGYERHTDAENDTTYYVFDTEYLDIPGADAGDEEISSVTLNSTFVVNETESPVYTERSEAYDTAALAEPRISVDDLNSSDVLVVEPGEVTVTGDTNIAPETELQVTVRSNDDTAKTPFLFAQDVTVGEDGAYNATFDLSEHEDKEFTVTVKSLSAVSKTTEVSGYVGVVEPPETTTTTEQPTTTTTTTTEQPTTTTTATTEQPTTTTEQPTTTTDDDGTATTTSTETPGFTIGLALIALLGAALVALRRRN